MAEQRSSSVLTAPVRGAASVLGRLPGAGMVSRVAQGTLNRVGAVSPRSRRLAVYTGAGVLGVAGVVEWPVALTGAAVAWLTQARPGAGGTGPGEADAGRRLGAPVEDGEPVERADVVDEPVPAEPDDEALAWAATHRTASGGERPGQRHGGPGEHGGAAPHGGHGAHGGRLGPTARPGRATR
ncbi:hypothetical protein [Streptomyces cellostaticus]|uniref:hypothetical protein n=1 Tax=Streptomyces cellostaticus TaxID=67285 RepID=UPI00202758B6|nr:hypothetical protein [Streptomyces cellostaticus]